MGESAAERAQQRTATSTRWLRLKVSDRSTSLTEPVAALTSDYFSPMSKASVSNPKQTTKLA
jgi:hypothetical protein